MSVSYTHLDVYKRQPILFTIDKYLEILMAVIVILITVIVLKPVSYTHLDVYKRQLQIHIRAFP